MGQLDSKQGRADADCKSCRQCPGEPEKLNPWRPRWYNKLDFTMTGISFVAGVHVMLSFPYLLANWGGAAFYVPYLLFTLLISFPNLFLDVSLGQFTSKGLFSCWECVPVMKGIGVAKLLVSFLYSVHFAVILGLYAYYFIASFMDPLPWTVCKEEWTSISQTACSDLVEELAEDQCVSFGYKTTPTGLCLDVNDKVVATWNRKSAIENHLIASAPYGFFSSDVAGVSWFAGLGGVGPLRWQLVVPAAVCWLIVFFSLMLGIKAYGKVAYVTTILGLLLQLALLGRALTLERAQEGIWNILKPDFSILTKPKVWLQGFNYAVLSVNFGLGGWTTLSSYNKFHRLYIWDCFVFLLVNVLWSFFGAITVFGFLSYFSGEQGVAVSEMLEKGLAFAIIKFPEIVMSVPNANLWSALFYLLLLVLGIGTQLCVVENLCTAFADIFRSFHSIRKRPILVAIICGFVFLSGLFLCTDFGLFGALLLNEVISVRNLVIIMISKYIVICYLYGFEKFNEDITCMIGGWNKFKYGWFISWYFICPVSLLCFLVWWLIVYITEEKDETFLGLYYGTNWIAVGWVIALLPIAAMILIGLFIWCQRCFTGKVKHHMTEPSVDWGPDLTEHKAYKPRYNISAEIYDNAVLTHRGGKGTMINVRYGDDSCKDGMCHRPQVIPSMQNINRGVLQNTGSYHSNLLPDVNTNYGYSNPNISIINVST